SNQLDADAGAQWDDGRHRRARRRRPQLAYESISGSDASDSSHEETDDRVARPPRASSMRSQRMRSIAAMSKLQHDAATTIQRLARQAQDLLDVFLLQEVASIVPTCLLDVLRETCMQEAETTKRRQDLATSLAGGVLSSLIDECIHDVFHDVLQAMVKSYFAQKIDLSRAATPPALAVAADILDDWTKELVADLLPEALAELASEYTARQQHEVVWESLVHDQLRSIASDAIVEATPDSTISRPNSPSSTNPVSTH
ncbi:hypothetical protein PHYSODRAFT_523500, partial [Phytophthora sojae]